jgi:hypothetical protein
MSFPSTLDNLATTRGGAGQTLSSPNHVTHHIAEDTAIQALQTKVGIDSSVDTNSLDYKVANRIPLNYLDTDITLSADSDAKVATQKAVKAYAQPALGYTPEDVADKGIADGYASLDSGGKVPASQLPASVTGAMNDRGTWDCSGGTYPTSPSAGYYYIASVAGTISGTAYLVGDWLAYNGTSWDKIDNQTVVSSVNSQVGAVVLTTAHVADSTNKRYVTDAQLVVIGNTTGTNTGDNAVNSLYSGLVSNATHTGDATGSTALTVVKINGVSLAGLATGILKNTTTTGQPSIASAGDDYLAPNGDASALTNFPTLNQNTTGTADNVTGVVDIANGGTNMTAYSVGGAMVCNTADVLEMVTSVAGTTVLTNTAGVITWEAAGVGTGDVVGPASAVDNAIARFDLTTGKLIQSSLATIIDSGSINIPAGESYLIDGTALAVGDITDAQTEQSNLLLIGA